MGNQVGERGEDGEGVEDTGFLTVFHVNLYPFLPKSLALSLQQLWCHRRFSLDNLFIDTHIVTTIPKEQTSACFTFLGAPNIRMS